MDKPCYSAQACWGLTCGVPCKVGRQEAKEMRWGKGDLARRRFKQVEMLGYVNLAPVAQGPLYPRQKIHWEFLAILAIWFREV